MKTTTKWYHPISLWRFAIVVFAGVLIFAGVMSLVNGDPVVRYTVAGVIVLFIAKELW